MSTLRWPRKRSRTDNIFFIHYKGDSLVGIFNQEFFIHIDDGEHWSDDIIDAMKEHLTEFYSDASVQTLKEAKEDYKQYEKDCRQQAKELDKWPNLNRRYWDFYATGVLQPQPTLPAQPGLSTRPIFIPSG